MKSLFEKANVIILFLMVLLLTITTIVTPKEKISELEKRKLASLPTFSIKSWMSGAFGPGMDDFLADHIFSRNTFMTFSDDLKNCFSHEIFFPKFVDSTEVKLVKIIRQEPKMLTEKVNQGLDTSNQIVVMNDPNQDLTLTEGVYIYDSCAYQFFGGSKNSENRYAKSVNELKTQLGDSVKLYSLLVPTSTEFCLPKEKYRGKTTSEEKAISFIFSRLSNKILTTNIYPRLAEHNKEYLFFKTDHHWTARGAYYAYLDFSTTANFAPLSLEQMKPNFMKKNFLGSLYAMTRDLTLKGNPDKLEYFDINFNGAKAYYKMKANDPWSKTQIINKKGEYGIGYGVFLGVDYPVMRIDGPVKNGRKLMVIKDSYANAFIPFLVNHFEKIYVADIRYFPFKIVDFVKANGINEVLVMNLTITANSPYISKKLLNLIK